MLLLFCLGGSAAISNLVGASAIGKMKHRRLINLNDEKIILTCHKPKTGSHLALTF